MTSPRTAGYAVARLLERALPTCACPVSADATGAEEQSTNVTWRRYNGFKPSLVPLVEGVTPAPNFITKTDVSAVLRQYGERAQLSDVILDTHEDPVLMENADIMGEGCGAARRDRDLQRYQGRHQRAVQRLVGRHPSQHQQCDHRCGARPRYPPARARTPNA